MISGIILLISQPKHLLWYSLKCLAKQLLMNIPNLGFYGEFEKIIRELSLDLPP